jgi:hypothetical protein
MCFLPAQMLMLTLSAKCVYDCEGKHTEIYTRTALLCDQQSAASGVRIHDNVLSCHSYRTVPGAVKDKRGATVE